MNESNQSLGPRSGRRRLGIVTLLVGLLLLAGGGLLVMNLVAGRANGAAESADEKGEEEKAPVPVEVAAVAPGRVSAYLSSTANLVAESEVKVLAEVEGRVSGLMVEEGDLVGRGQTLATLVRDEQEIRLNKAELKAADARLAFERVRDLVEKELVSRQEFDKLKVEHEIAQQELAEARWSLDKTVIRAPFGGRVTGRMTQLGQHVRPGDELFQITDFDPLIARIYLPERDVLGLEEGRPVAIRLNADDSVRFAGRIRQISPVVDTATGTVKLTLEAVAPPAQVRPGSFVTIDIVRETRPDALLVPREAVLRELQRAHVFVAAEGVAVKREVTLGLEEGELVEALSGLEQGDRVIVAGQGGLKDGAPIKVLEPEHATG